MQERDPIKRRGEGNLQDNDGNPERTAVNRPAGQLLRQTSLEHKKLIQCLTYVKMLRKLHTREQMRNLVVTQKLPRKLSKRKNKTVVNFKDNKNICWESEYRTQA